MTAALNSYRLLFKWQYLRMRKELAMIVVIQLFLALGIVYGLAFLIPTIDKRSALFLATGAPTLTLLVMGLTVVPQEISRLKVTGAWSYFSTLPIPRLAAPAADLTFWLLAQLPGTILVLIIASLRFGFALRVNPAVVPAVLLVALSGACVGYAFGMLLKPAVANQLASFIAIVILLFSPINFPIERLPAALQAVHRVLPITYMADLIRWSLTGQFVQHVGLAFAVVGAWSALGIAISWRVAVRRV